MNREQMVAKAYRALHQFSACGCDPDDGDMHPMDLHMATEVVDVLLPQVTTVEELEALPVGAQVLDGSGMVWRAWRWTPAYQTFFYSSTPTFGAYEAAEVLARGPLTVVWRP